MSGGVAAAAAGSRGNGTSAMIPAGSRKLVQSLKEIVNCSEAEIFAMLRECNMDPNEAVHRLLSQDTFHEVKSKRDKKKEIREPPESRSRTVNSSLGRARTARGSRGTSQSTYTDHGASKGKVVHKKENGTNALPTSSSLLESSAFSSNSPQRTTVQSNSAFIEISVQAANVADNRSVPTQASSGSQRSWSGRPGHMSMADIVKMGRPQVKSACIAPVASEGSHMVQNAAMLNMPRHDVKQSPIAVLSVESEEIPEPFQESTHVSDFTQDLGIAEGQHISQDGWSINEQPIDSGSTPLHTSAVYANESESTSSNLVVDRRNLYIDPHSEEIQLTDDSLNVANLPANCESASASASASDRQKEVDSSVESPYLNDGLQKNMNPHQSERVGLDHHEGSFPAGGVRMEISSAAADLRQLSLNEETNAKHIDPNPAVIIPDHLRVTNADCAHLSFGSFVSGSFSGSLPSKPLKSDLEVVTIIDDAAKINGSDVRNHENYSDEQLRPTLTEHAASRSGTALNLDMPSASQAEVVRNDPSDAAHRLQYNLPSVSGYAFSSSTEPSAAHAYLQGNTQMQNISPFSSLLQPNALQSSSLAASIPSLQDLDLPLSPLLTTQSMPSNFSTLLPSSSGPTISMPEALNPGAFANPQSTPQSLPSTTMLTSPALAQHLHVPHYSQPALPLSHFANMIGYPLLPQSYAYLPSFANSPFHQAPAVPGVGMKYSQPQYKSSLPVTSLPQASTIASGYGGFGSSANMPGTLNHSASSASTTMGLDEALSLQYKEANYMSLLQRETPAMWIHGPGARTMSALQPNTFYNYQVQNQLGGLPQTQQSSQFGALGYPSLYQSQMGPSREHQQNPSEGNLNGSQSMQSQLTNQIWQHGY